MAKSKTLIPVLLALPVILVIIFIHLNLPEDAQAKPLAGFTPTPTPSSGGGGGGGGGGDSNDKSAPPTKDEPTDYIWVQIYRCNLHCSTSSASADDQPDFQSLVSVGTTDASQGLLIPLTKPQSLPELLTPVRLVHDGSAFIVEGELSDMKPTRISVPYPGLWEIWLTGSPHFNTTEAVDVTGFNLADLQIQLANGPILLGPVEANTTEPQWVNCPLACVVAELPIAETPLTLPVTGKYQRTGLSGSALLIIGFNSGLLCLMLWAAFCYSARNHHS